MNFSYAHGVSETPLLGETLGACLNRVAAKFGDRDALVSCHQAIRYTYRELHRIVETVARGFISLGVQRARADAGTDEVVIEFSRDVIQKFVCPSCGEEEEKYSPAGKLRLQEASCPKDGNLRTVVSVHSFSGSEDFGYRRLDQLGLPLLDLFVARSTTREIGYIPYGDASLVLGPVLPREI